VIEGNKRADLFFKVQKQRPILEDLAFAHRWLGAISKGIKTDSGVSSHKRQRFATFPPRGRVFTWMQFVPREIALANYETVE
jgi:hypothetical protein